MNELSKMFFSVLFGLVLVCFLVATNPELIRAMTLFFQCDLTNECVFPVQGQVSCACVDTVSGLKTLEKLQEWGFLNLSTKEGAESKAL